MNRRHPYEKGVACERCKEKVDKSRYTRIRYSQPIASDTTGREKYIGSMTLCDICYHDYLNLLDNWKSNRI